MLISGIEKTKKGRYSVFCDGAFLFSVSEESYITTELAAGAEIAPERLEEIRLADEVSSAKEKSLTLLSYSAQSRGMLLRKLGKYYSREASEAAADRMAELGLLDDRDYGRRLAADMANLRGYSRARIRAELQKRGLERDVVDEIMSDPEAADESAAIAAIIRKKHMAKLDTPEGIKKAVGSLMRQGFCYEDIKAALRLVIEE